MEPSVGMTTAFHRLRLIWLCLAGLLCATTGSFASNRWHDSSGDGLLAAKAGGRTIADTLPKGITDIKNAKEASSEASRITSQHSTFVN